MIPADIDNFIITNFSHNNIEDVSPLSALSSLKIVNLNNNKKK